MNVKKFIAILLSGILSVVLIVLGAYYVCHPLRNTEWMVGKNIETVQARCGDFDFYYQRDGEISWGAYYVSYKSYDEEIAKYLDRNKKVTDMGCYAGSVVYVNFTDGVVTKVRLDEDYDPSYNWGL